MYNMFEVGPNIRAIRKGRGLTIEKVADKSGISEVTLCKLEQGNRNLTLKNMFALMSVYKVDANTLLGVSVEETEDSIDMKLLLLSKTQRAYFKKTFLFMLNGVTDALKEVV